MAAVAERRLTGLSPSARVLLVVCVNLLSECHSVTEGPTSARVHTNRTGTGSEIGIGLTRWQGQTRCRITTTSFYSPHPNWHAHTHGVCGTFSFAVCCSSLVQLSGSGGEGSQPFWPLHCPRHWSPLPFWMSPSEAPRCNQRKLGALCPVPAHLWASGEGHRAKRRLPQPILPTATTQRF